MISRTPTGESSSTVTPSCDTSAQAHTQEGELGIAICFDATYTVQKRRWKRSRHWISCRHCLASEVVTGILPWGTTYTINSIVCRRQLEPERNHSLNDSYSPLCGGQKRGHPRSALFLNGFSPRTQSPTAYLCGRVLYSSCCVRPHTSIAKNVCRSRAHCSVAATATHREQYPFGCGTFN